MSSSIRDRGPSTPGHTPDSLCLRVGGILFASDLLFAANPGIAGISGWCREDLARSFERMLDMLRGGGFEAVYPAHGAMLSVDDAIAVCEAGLRRTRSLPDLITMDVARRDRLEEHARAALDEAGRLFTLIAGRRLRLARLMDELEEPDAATDIAGRLDDVKIEEILEEFMEIKALAPAVGVDRTTVLLRALRVADRLKRLFDPRRMDGLMDVTLPRRTQRVLTDYINAAYGVRYDPSVSCDLAVTLQEITARLLVKPYDNESVFDQPDTPEDFRAELIRRLSYVPLFKGAGFTIDIPQGVEVKMDPEMLEDLVITLLEPLAASGTRQFTFTAPSAPEPSTVVLRIAGSGGSLSGISPSGLEYWRSTLRFLGGDLRAPSAVIRELVFPALT